MRQAVVTFFFSRVIKTKKKKNLTIFLCVCESSSPPGESERLFFSVEWLMSVSAIFFFSFLSFREVRHPFWVLYIFLFGVWQEQVHPSKGLFSRTLTHTFNK